jgi:2-oxoglutarate dehydrogenase E1 component
MATPFDTDTSLFAGNAAYVEMLYERWLKSPSSVDASWQGYFAGVKAMHNGASKAVTRPSWSTNKSEFVDEVVAPLPAKDGKPAKKESAPSAAATSTDIVAAAQDTARALQIINAYRVRGHLMGNYDPLGLELPKPHPELDPQTYGFTEKDYGREIYIGGALGLERATLSQILEILRQTYSGTLGVEFMHIQFPEQKLWIQKRIESNKARPPLSEEEKKFILRCLVEVESFEEFVQLKHTGTKRFSIQGGDATIPGIEAALLASSAMGVEEAVIGMPHRGRMNVITTIMGKPYVELLSIFQGNLDFPEWVDSSGDVKYHLGVSNDRTLINGKKIHLSLASNPSHLEAVNPVVQGKVRAKQDQKNDKDTKNKVMGILLHGDAAFAGQGTVAEALSLAELRGYRTGGTLHLIVNNQIGFTTSPKNARFTPYPSDMAKAIQAPIFHINGDDPEAVFYACKLAAEFRQEFKRDVVVDIVCYRKYGHNESDEPMFTQPLMYKAIAKHTLPARLYAAQLLAEGMVTQDQIDSLFKEYRMYLDKEYESAKTFKPNKANWLEGHWSGFEKPKGEHATQDTGVDEKKLKEIGYAISSVPEGFTLNSKVIRQLEAKKKMMDDGAGIDWATGEALAFGTLLKENYSVRFTGQDVCRGTFSHRHAVLIDQANEERYTPLNNLGGTQKQLEIYESSLSEFAIMGFEYGYSLAEPNALTLWEAQFGDFANGAQVMIDQFIASGEIKWLRMSGLVLLLPHGYEGQGPEHSSARLERFLQLCGEDNMQVVNCTTPASYFHVLRRQLVGRKFRKPLIIMTPKSLLRHKLAVSKLSEMTKGTSFQRVIGETQKLADDAKIKRVVFCTGKVYYDLLEEREKRAIKDIAIVRCEQLYPFPEREIREQMKKYKNAEIMWCQEEPENMGAYRFMGPKMGYILEDLGKKDLRIKYAGRPEAASPAAGYAKIHEKEQKQLVDDAFNLAIAGSALIKKAANG